MVQQQMQVVSYYPKNRRLCLRSPIASDWPTSERKDSYTTLVEIRNWLAMGRRVRIQEARTHADRTSYILGKIAADLILPGMTEQQLLAMILPELAIQAEVKAFLNAK